MSQRAWMVGATLGAAVVARAVVRRWSRYDLRDKVVVLTGGSRGLGLVLARQLVDQGARLALCARAGDELSRARSELEARGGRVLAATCDVTDPVQIEIFLARVREELGAIDVVINNAGVIGVGPLEHMTVDDFERAMATHFWGPLRLTLAVLPEMRARGEGRIVNIASIGGRVAVPHLAPYTASKFALVGLSEGMRAELAQHGILVTTVVPGLMRTGSPPNAMFKGQHRAEYAWFALGASLPISSMSAERAARRIVRALRHGDPDLVLSAPAKLATTLHALAPGLVQRALGLVNRMLPGPGGIGSEAVPGRASTSPVSESVLTRATARAARKNNEL